MNFNLADLLKDVSDLGTGREQIEYITLDLIEEDPNNFYKLSGIDELAANIELCGLQQPIRVRAIPDSCRYRIVSGHRRRKAVEMLAQDDPERWNEIPCIIEADEASPALQQLRLIYANANTRTMTPAEVSEQAVQVEKLLYQLKEDGYEFPGRMRDHVAQAVGQSKSKLARLKVIRDNLAAVWQPSFKDGTLSESTAYELAKAPKAYQSLLFEEKSRTNANLKWLYADDVKKFVERATNIEKMTCKAFGGDCSNYECKMRKAAVSERWGWFHCDNKCCKDCPELVRCKNACPKLKDIVAKRRADAKEVARAAKEAQEKQDAPAVEQISALWQRFGLLREMAGKDLDECKKVLNTYYFAYEYDKAMRLERGEEKVTKDTKLPYGCFLTDITRLIAIADMFECSLDYLLCRTDANESAQVVPESGIGSIWNTGVPQAYGTYVAYVQLPGAAKKMLRELVWTGDEWLLFGNKIDDGATVVCWADQPEV